VIFLVSHLFGCDRTSISNLGNRTNHGVLRMSDKSVAALIVSPRKELFLATIS
jgi:hypothetical protein